MTFVTEERKREHVGRITNWSLIELRSYWEQGPIPVEAAKFYEELIWQFVILQRSEATADAAIARSRRKMQQTLESWVRIPVPASSI